MKPTIEGLRATVRMLHDTSARRESRDALLAALDVAEGCVDWVKDGEACHLCGGFGPNEQAHDDECPVGAFLATITPSKPEET
jgi:hypothetical protein